MSKVTKRERDTNSQGRQMQSTIAAKAVKCRQTRTIVCFAARSCAALAAMHVSTTGATCTATSNRYSVRVEEEIVAVVELLRGYQQWSAQRLAGSCDSTFVVDTKTHTKYAQHVHCSVTAGVILEDCPPCGQGSRLDGYFCSLPGIYLRHHYEQGQRRSFVLTER